MPNVNQQCVELNIFEAKQQLFCFANFGSEVYDGVFTNDKNSNVNLHNEKKKG